MQDSLMVLIITSITCSIIGVFLILRKLSMLTDAISHTVLLGIVLAYFIVKDLDSSLLIIGASLLGLVTVYLVEAIGKKGISKYDDAIGMVFPVLFSLAVLLISKYFRNVHLDTDVVLMGEVLFSSLVSKNILNHEISVPLLHGLVVLILTLIFVIGTFQKLKISTFDKDFAHLLGIPTSLIFYLLMTLTSITSVVSFNSVGAILVISFFIGPAGTSLQICKSLKSSLILASAIGVFNCIVGFYLAVFLNVSIAGLVATINMIIYLAIVVAKKYIDK